MESVELSTHILETAKRFGVSQADVCLQMGTSLNITAQRTNPQIIIQSDYKHLTLRFFVDKRMSSGSLSDVNSASIEDTVQTLVSLAKLADPDLFNGLPEREDCSLPNVDLDLYDDTLEEVPIEKKIEMAQAMKNAALDFDHRISHIRRASYQEWMNTVLIANSEGLLRSFNDSICKLSCRAIAREAGQMQMGDQYIACHRFKDLPHPAEIGKDAAMYAVQRLGGVKVKTQRVPIVFHPIAAKEFWIWVFYALDGSFVSARKSFLQDKLGNRVASSLVTVIDDGTIPGGLGSSPFDGEGVPTRKKELIQEGILTGYLYNGYTARKAGTCSTGNAFRTSKGEVNIKHTNFYLAAGESHPQKIIESVQNGFYVTSLVPAAGDTATGSYSAPAAGLWIENGRLTYPVEEVTIAGNLTNILQQIEMVGNDLDFADAIASPTFKVSEMTVSGT